MRSSFFSFIRIVKNRKIIHTRTQEIRKYNVLAHQVAQKGGSITIVSDVYSSPHISGSLLALTLNV